MTERLTGAPASRPDFHHKSGLAEWRSLIDTVFVHFDFDAPDPGAFRGKFSSYTLGRVELFEIEGSAHSVRRHAAHLVHGDAPRTIVTLHERGKCRITRDGTSATSQAGDIFVLHSTKPFELCFTGEMKVWVVSIPAQLLGHELLSSDRLSGLPISDGVGMSAVSWDLIRSLARHRQRLSEVEARQLGSLLLDTLNILASSALESSGCDPLDMRSYHVERIRRYIGENLRNPELNAGRVAKALGLSQRYMNKLFEPEDTTVGRLILELRLQGARRDLDNVLKRAKSITEIAYDWGFSSVSHFSRVFRRRYRASPRQRKGFSDQATRRQVDGAPGA